MKKAVKVKLIKLHLYYKIDVKIKLHPI